MNTEGAPTEVQKWLPSKGPPSIHQKALFVFWVSVVSLMVFRKLLLLLKVPSLRSALRHTAPCKQGMVVYLTFAFFKCQFVCSFNSLAFECVQVQVWDGTERGSGKVFMVF